MIEMKKLGYRIREAQINKIPVQLVIGDEEVQNRSVNIRRYQQKEQINCNLLRLCDKYNKGKRWKVLMKKSLVLFISIYY